MHFQTLAVSLAIFSSSCYAAPSPAKNTQELQKIEEGILPFGEGCEIRTDFESDASNPIMYRVRCGTKICVWGQEKSKTVSANSTKRVEVEYLNGKISGCPSGKLTLRLFEEFLENRGYDEVTLKDESEIPLITGNATTVCFQNH